MVFLNQLRFSRATVLLCCVIILYTGLAISHSRGHNKHNNKGSADALLRFKQEIAQTMSKSEAVAMILAQAASNEREVAALETKFREQQAQLTAEMQKAMDAIAESQRARDERLVEHARRLQSTFDRTDVELSQLVEPSTTWLVRSGGKKKKKHI